jgi:hypothetical protein
VIAGYQKVCCLSIEALIDVGTKLAFFVEDQNPAWRVRQIDDLDRGATDQRIHLAQAEALVFVSRLDYFAATVKPE